MARIERQMIAEDLQMHSEQPEETKTPEPRNGHELLDAELLATVGHELRSPLASIKGYAATLLHHEHRLTREERLEFLAAIHDASHQLSTVIDHMLEIAELETNATIIQPSATDAVQLARETIAAVEHLKKSASGSPLEPG